MSYYLCSENKGTDQLHITLHTYKLQAGFHDGTHIIASLDKWDK